MTGKKSWGPGVFSHVKKAFYAGLLGVVPVQLNSSMIYDSI